jgi:two-component system sensor histidine kinase AlgZ
MEIMPALYAGPAGSKTITLRVAPAMRQNEGSARQDAVETYTPGLDLASMTADARSNLFSFWKLQALGWSGFYLLVSVASLAFLKETGVFWGNTIFVVLLFLASCALRYACRALLRRSLTWLALELRLFAWSLLAGALATLGTELLTPGAHSGRFDWANALVDLVQFSVVLFLWCSLYVSIKQWQHATGERERLLRAEAEVREARLAALRYQLHPHFLFNSLNAVSTLVLEGNASGATRMLSQISELLRSTLDGEIAAEIPLAQELAFTDRYLAIEQTRLGDRLRIEMAIAPETLDALVPCMLLQPLLENAVRHGIAPHIAGGTLRVESRRLPSQLQIVIRNSGAPRPPTAAGESTSGNGVGLKNTTERLRTFYGSDQKLDLRWPQQGGCEVIVQLPLRNGAS